MHAYHANAVFGTLLHVARIDCIAQQLILCMLDDIWLLNSRINFCF